MTGNMVINVLNQAAKYVLIMFGLLFLCIVVLTLIGPSLQPPPITYQWTLIDSTTFEQTTLDVSNTTSQIAWSPARAQIAYVVESQYGGDSVYVQSVGDDGQPKWFRKRVLESEKAIYELQWSPDGTRLAFIEGANYQGSLYVLDVKSRSKQQLSDFTVAHFSWSPDSKSIAATSMVTGEGQALYVIDVMSGEARQIVAEIDATERPAWSPDGEQLLFQSSVGQGYFKLFAVNVDGSSRAQVTELPAIEHNFQWSLDGKHILFEAIEATSPSIYLAAADGFELSAIVQRGPGEAAECSSWSPVGKRILFRAQVADSYSQELYIMELPEQTITQITGVYRREACPKWTADGQFIILFQKQENYTGAE
jgi:Tol biopolymer transport system component